MLVGCDPGVADSRARIVRLSDVEGTIQVDRNVGQGYEKAFLNMPITEGMQDLGQRGRRGEVEFEDGSVLHMVPDTKLTFSQLSLRDSGGKVTTINVDEGTAYVNFVGKSEDEFTVNFGHESVTLTNPAHLRISLDDEKQSWPYSRATFECRGRRVASRLGRTRAWIST